MKLEKETQIYQLGAIAADINTVSDLAASKNSIFHQATAPSTSGRKVGDIWYDSDDDYAMYKFDGTSWVLEQFGTDAIKAASITAARLDAQDVYTNFLRVYFLSAAQAEIESLSAITANLGSVNVGGVNNEDGVLTVKNASNVTIGTWDNSGINAQGKFKATNGSETCVLDSDALGAYVSAANSVTSIRMSANHDGSVGLYEVIPVSGGGDEVAILWERTGLALTTGFPLTVGYFPATPNDGVTIDTTGYINAMRSNGAAWVQARNADGGNGIWIQAENAGTATLGSRTANGTTYTILQRANNSGLITAYNSWIFNSYDTHDSGIILRNTGLTKGTTPSADTNKVVVFTDKDGFTSSQNDVIGAIYSGVGSNNTSYVLIRTFKNITSASTYAQVTLNYPATGNPYLETSDGCHLYVGGDVISTTASGEAHITARNSYNGNRIMFWANSDGRCGVYSYDSTNTARAILTRANNSGNITAYGSWTFDSTITGTITPPSDIRLKTNIVDCKVSALPLINSIRMREFDWTDGRHQCIGMVADELEELDYKLAIGGGYDINGKMVIKGVDEFYLIGYLVKAIQELSAEVNKLRGAA